MSILQRLDVAISKAHSEAHEVIELDITADDYVELMGFAAEIDDRRLEEAQLDMTNQTYRGYPFRMLSGLRESGVIRDDGAEPLPTDRIAEQDSRIVLG